MRLTLPLLFLLALTLSAAPALAQAVSLPLTISDGADGSRTLHFGVDPAATDGIDPALGEAELPPFPPTGAFEARFVDEDISTSGLGNGSYRDYREGAAEPEGVVAHEVRYQVGDGSTITLSWDLPPTVTGRLQDVITGSIVDVQMEGSGSYTVDNPGGLNKLKLTVTYIQPNSAPTPADDDATTDEDTPVDIGVLGNDSDPDGDELTVTAVSDPTNGTATLLAGDVRYTPDADYNGPDSFTYTVEDAAGAEATATVSVTVTPINDAPAFDSEPVTSATEDELYTYEAAASDIDGDALTLTAGDLPAWLAFMDEGDGTGTLSGMPGTDDTGAHEIALTASDGTLETTQTFTLVVGDGANQTPVAADDAAVTNEDTPIEIDVLANDTDADGDPLSVTSVSEPANGTAAVGGDNAVLYTPASNYFGEDSFTYTVSDGAGGEATAEVVVTVTPVNDPPSPATITAPEDGARGHRRRRRRHTRDSDLDPLD